MIDQYYYYIYLSVPYISPNTVIKFICKLTNSPISIIQLPSLATMYLSDMVRDKYGEQFYLWRRKSVTYIYKIY